MLEFLQHGKFVVDHLLIALDVFLQYDLDGHLLAVDVGFSDDSICACAKGLSETILRPKAVSIGISFYNSMVRRGMEGEDE